MYFLRAKSLTGPTETCTKRLSGYANLRGLPLKFQVSFVRWTEAFLPGRSASLRCRLFRAFTQLTSLPQFAHSAVSLKFAILCCSSVSTLLFPHVVAVAGWYLKFIPFSRPQQLVKYYCIIFCYDIINVLLVE